MISCQAISTIIPRRLFLPLPEGLPRCVTQGGKCAKLLKKLFAKVVTPAVIADRNIKGTCSFVRASQQAALA